MDNSRRRGHGRTAFLVAAAIGAAICSFGEPVKSIATPNTFGTVTTTCHMVTAYELLPLSSTASMDGDAQGGRYLAAGANGTTFAGVTLPAGAELAGIELEACDTNAVPAAAVEATLFECTGGSFDAIAFAQTIGAPGCTR